MYFSFGRYCQRQVSADALGREEVCAVRPRDFLSRFFMETHDAYIED